MMYDLNSMTNQENRDLEIEQQAEMQGTQKRGFA